MEAGAVAARCSPGLGEQEGASSSEDGSHTPWPGEDHKGLTVHSTRDLGAESPLSGKHAMLGAGNLAEGTSGPLRDSSLPGSHTGEVGMRSGPQDKGGRCA